MFCDLKKDIITAVEVAINEYGINTFYVGDRGDFDRHAAGAVRSLKYKYPNIKLVLVLPYFTNKLNEYKEIYKMDYDSIYIPTELADVHPKGAITKRNRIMVDESELIICYINRDFGGAYDTVKYAERQNKNIIHIEK